MNKNCAVCGQPIGECKLHVTYKGGVAHLSCLENPFPGYQPEAITVRKDLIHDAEHALRLGLAYARQCLSDHKAAHGRATHKDALLTESMEREVRQIEAAHEALRKAVGG